MSGVIAAVVGVSVAGTAYSMYQADKQRKQAEELAKKQEDAQRQLEADAKKRMKNEETAAQAASARDSAVASQRGLASKNRSGTLLTSPLSTLGSNLTNSSSGKTLIGQ